MPTTPSPKRRPSRTASRRSKILQSLPSKSKPGLALDTSVSRHRAPAPKQVFPYESKTQELSFISLADIKALKKQKNVKKVQDARQQHLDNVQPQDSSITFPTDAITEDVSLPYSRSNTTDHSYAPALHKRIKGLRPSPLDLNTDISPSDRAITIGISLDSDSVPRHSRTPSSPQAIQHYPSTIPQRWPSEKHGLQEASTPTIVITPARENFDVESRPQASPGNIDGDAERHRPASSVYSRYTNCMPADGHTPRVPPLPLFAVGKASKVRQSDGPSPEEEASNLTVPKRQRKKNLSVCTVFEEDQQSTPDSKRMTSQSHLPTPRRSRGWWNLITSPFSASSRSNAFFWRSPSSDEDGDRTRMLDDDALSGADEHEGIIFTNRSVNDLDLRSAPPVDSQRNSFSASRHQPPQRSDTAPGALDINGHDGVDIYSIPYVGAAADYYNPHKNFPSVIILPQGDGSDRELDGWSPSQSVYREPRGSVQAEIANVDDDADDSDSTFFDDDPFEDGKEAGSRGVENEKSPFNDSHASNAFDDFSGTHPAATSEKQFFSSPATEELRAASPEQPARMQPTRNDTQGTMGSCFSPLTATPTIEDARMGTLMGPSVVDVTKSRSASPQNAGLGAATMASRGVEDDRAMSEKAPFRHQRNDSYGLGIDTDSDRDSMSEKSLFPPPKLLAQQPRLGTDRFGQLRIEDGDCEPDWSPWYQRFLWPLLGLAGACLILFVVLLAVFVTRDHKDMPVQAQWLNLTGFPAMPTGVATVVQPKKEAEVGGCVQPAGLWSAAVPAGEGEGSGDAPNFRFEIRFRNETRKDMNSTELAPASSSAYRRSASGASQASSVVRRSAWSETLFAPVPAPPSKDDMTFLGNTTDGVSEPYEGEETPFYISLLNASALAEPRARGAKGMRLAKREKGAGVYPYPTNGADSSSSDDSSAPSSSNTTSTHDKPKSKADSNDSSSAPSTNAPSSIPRPLVDSDDHPAPPQLYPLPQAQPLRLFDRGKASEHYGFYTYFDRTVYVKTASNSSQTTTNATSLFAGDIEANVRLAESNVVCTFGQTRFRVQIWTRKPLVTALNNNTTDILPAADDSSANAMQTPGSFPYAVSLTLDRHGGDAGKKGVYCYGLDAEGRVVDSEKAWVPEERGFDGGLVLGADVPGGDGGEHERGDGKWKGEGKGVDGGQGGCRVEWRNW